MNQQYDENKLINIWETGYAHSPIRRAMALLEGACAGEQPPPFEKLSIGQRNNLLLTLREQLFGAQLESIVTCPACTESLEINFSTSSIKAESLNVNNDPVSVDFGDYHLLYRLPNSEDLSLLEDIDDAGIIRDKLLEWCLLDISTNSGAKKIHKDDIPDEILNRLLDKMEQDDPMSTIQLSIICPACNHQWLSQLDILSYLWSELGSWAYQTLQDVHQLASLYGWSENEIFSISSLRRQTYLRMAT